MNKVIQNIVYVILLLCEGGMMLGCTKSPAPKPSVTTSDSDHVPLPINPSGFIKGCYWGQPMTTCYVQMESQIVELQERLARIEKKESK